MTMVEKIEQALIKTFNAQFGHKVELESAEDLARAALEAMREPSEAMLNCDVECDSGGIQKASDYLDYVSAGPLWHAMIDAALNEKSE